LEKLASSSILGEGEGEETRRVRRDNKRVKGEDATAYGDG